jgi:hypothetical protein
MSTIPNPTQAAEANARSAILARLRAAAVPQAPALPDVKGWFDAHQRHEDTAQRVRPPARRDGGRQDRGA